MPAEGTSAETLLAGVSFLDAGGVKLEDLGEEAQKELDELERARMRQQATPQAKVVEHVDGAPEASPVRVPEDSHPAVPSPDHTPPADELPAPEVPLYQVYEPVSQSQQDGDGDRQPNVQPYEIYWSEEELFRVEDVTDSASIWGAETIPGSLENLGPDRPTSELFEGEVTEQMLFGEHDAATVDEYMLPEDDEGSDVHGYLAELIGAMRSPSKVDVEDMPQHTKEDKKEKARLDATLRRMCTPKADGSVDVPKEIYEKYLDKGRGRDELRELLKKCN
ncbi:unnamed protein product, partial [Durusdinium trenchii]